jgi:hypothetical protein
MLFALVHMHTHTYINTHINVQNYKPLRLIKSSRTYIYDGLYFTLYCVNQTFPNNRKKTRTI